MVACYSLNDEIEDSVSSRRCDPRESHCADLCMKELQALLHLLDGDWRVEAVGSRANGLASRGCDLNLTMFKECAQADASHGSSAGPSIARRWLANSKTSLSQLQQQLLPLLTSTGRFQKKEAVWQAPVPTLWLKYDGRLDVVLTYNDQKARLSSTLLQAYSRLCAEVPTLIRAVKLWAREQRVHGTAEGNLSSYSFALLVIYFLQVNLNMPCIPVEALPKEAPILSWCPYPACGLSSLLCGFFEFYCRDFDWGREVVSVRTGRREFISSETYARLAGQGVHRLHLEDPVLCSRNLNCVMSLKQESALKDRLRSSYAALSSALLPPGLLPDGAQVWYSDTSSESSENSESSEDSDSESKEDSSPRSRTAREEELTPSKFSADPASSTQGETRTRSCSSSDEASSF